MLENILIQTIPNSKNNLISDFIQVFKELSSWQPFCHPNFTRSTIKFKDIHPIIMIVPKINDIYNIFCENRWHLEILWSVILFSDTSIQLWHKGKIEFLDKNINIFDWLYNNGGIFKFTHIAIISNCNHMYTGSYWHLTDEILYNSAIRISGNTMDNIPTRLWVNQEKEELIRTGKIILTNKQSLSLSKEEHLVIKYDFLAPKEKEIYDSLIECISKGHWVSRSTAIKQLLKCTNFKSAFLRARMKDMCLKPGRTRVSKDEQINGLLFRKVESLWFLRIN